jgi:hypothetical protein
LRTKWTAVHTDEVLFRDTAHGFLAWALATVIGVAVLASAASSVVSGGARTATSLVSGASQGTTQSAASGGGIGGYYIDQLFRSDRDSASGQDPRAEVTRIIATDLRSGSVPDEDKTYLAQLTASRTGISQDEARQRVDRLISQAQTTEQKAKEGADQPRKAAASASFYTFFSMLIGAFIASVAGALGGRSRDEY